AARSILSASICLTIALRTVPVLTAAFGALTMLEQPARAATMRAKKQAFAKLNRNFLPAVSTEREASRATGTWPIRIRAGRRPVWWLAGRWPVWIRPGRWSIWLRAGGRPVVDTGRRPLGVDSLWSHAISCAG